MIRTNFQKEYVSHLSRTGKYHVNHIMMKDGSGYVEAGDYDGYGMINSLDVDYGYRFNGIGTYLLSLAENFVAHYYDEVYIYVEYNSWMHAWYKKLGYEDIPEEKGQDYVRMVKKFIQYKVKVRMISNEAGR